MKLDNMGRLGDQSDKKHAEHDSIVRRTIITFVLLDISVVAVKTILILACVTIFTSCHVVGAQLCSSRTEPQPNSTSIRKDWEKACDSSFVYCMKDKQGSPSPAKCPTKLVFFPEKLKCDFPEKCSASSPSSTESSNAYPNPVETDAECPKKSCGLYPGGECNGYFICSGGIKIHKTCYGTNIFDVKTKECKDRRQGKCWQEMNIITPIIEEIKPKPRTVCPFHGNIPTEGAIDEAASPKSDSTGIVLASPQLTNYGEWQKWTYCSKGSYITGLSMWRRSTDVDGKFDHAGIVSFGTRCDNPVKKGKGEIIGQYSPGAPDDKWFNFLNCDEGAAIGFQLSQQDDQGLTGDDLGTDNVKMFCSCGKELIKTKPYHEPRPEFIKVGGHRGKWTTELFCKPKQSVCGFQTQMHKWKREKVINLEKIDRVGMEAFKLKCCDVDHPGVCVVREERMFLQTCDNRDSEILRRCPFNATVGIDYNFQKHDKAIAFYESIGFKMEESLPKLKSSVQAGVSCEHYSNGSCAYSWTSPEPRIFNVAQVESGQINVRSGIHVKLFQIVASCGVFSIHTNKLIKVRQNMKGQDLPDDPVIF